MSSYFTACVLTTSAFLAIACAHGVPQSDRAVPSSSEERGIWWAPSLGLRSLATIDSRLGERFGDQFEVERIASKSEPADHQVITDCGTYFTLQPRGYQPRSDGDAAALKVEGAKCRAVQALRSARPATRRRPFVLNRDSLTELPAALTPAPSPLEEERRNAAAQGRQSWHSYDGSASLLVTDAFRARVTATESITNIEVLGQADFDGDGTDDTLLLTVSGGTKGTWGEVHLRLLTRVATSQPLQVVKEFPL